MAAAFVILFQNERAIRRERTQNLDTLSDSELICRYRFPRQSIISLTDLLAPVLQRPTARSKSIPIHIKVMTTLRLLAKGDYLSEVSDVHGISTSSASRIISDVCNAVCMNMKNIVFPSTNEELRQAKDGFHSIANFPNVVGAIDGTLIPIKGMASEDEPSFICRKGFHAINVQAVVDSELRFTNIVVKWPGSTHDSFILNNSGIPDAMTGINGWLLGDSGYPLKKWLMTPLINPANLLEQRYNNSHCQTRNVVERSFGVLKSSFRCLHKTGGSLQFSPEKCVKIIGACFRLHNKAVDDRLPFVVDGQIPILDNNRIVDAINNINQAHAIRQRLIQKF